MTAAEESRAGILGGVQPLCGAEAPGADGCPHPAPCPVSQRGCALSAAPCGGTVHNATIGRVLSPSYTGNQSSSMFCIWAIGAPPGQKLHLHFEKLLLTEKDR